VHVASLQVRIPTFVIRPSLCCQALEFSSRISLRYTSGHTRWSGARGKGRLYREVRSCSERKKLTDKWLRIDGTPGAEFTWKPSPKSILWYSIRPVRAVALLFQSYLTGFISPLPCVLTGHRNSDEGPTVRGINIPRRGCARRRDRSNGCKGGGAKRASHRTRNFEVFFFCLLLS
jgi:hypothetical protein